MFSSAVVCLCIFTDFCQSNYLNIYRTDLYEISRDGRAVTVDKRSEVVFFDASTNFLLTVFLCHARSPKRHEVGIWLLWKSNGKSHVISRMVQRWRETRQPTTANLTKSDDICTMITSQLPSTTDVTLTS